nr:MBG domain-containing protein [uncultured Butyrivibrio sp.]
MLKKWNRLLAVILAFALVTTTFGSDIASTRAFAVESDEELAQQENEIQTAEWEQIPQEGEEPVQEEQPQEETVPEEVTEVTDQAAEESGAAGEDAATTEATTAAEATTESSTEEVATDASTESSSEDAATNASSEEIVEEAATAATSEAVVEEKLVTVRYKATKGGRVSSNKETVDINDKDSKFEGSTATAWNDKYTFVDWTDANGNQVSTDATFVPSGIEEDAEFTANFVAAEDISETMPSIEANEVHAGGLIVSVQAEEGLFPAGTELKISAIADEQAVATAEETLGKEVNKAKGVDISFVFEGNEIQPANNKYVHVKLDIEETIATENLTVLHDHGNEVEKIDANVSSNSQGNAETVEFDSNQFSVFIVVDGNDDDGNNREVGTIRFYSGIKGSENNEIIMEKTVKNGDIIPNPGIPKIGENQTFIGWFVDGNKNGTEVVFTNDEYEVSGITADAEINVYPVISATYYVTFIGTDGEIARVEKVVVENPDTDAELDLTGIDIPAGAGKAFKGWSKEKKNLYEDSDLITSYNVVEEAAKLEDGKGLTVYAVVVPAFWIRFKTNVGGERGAIYVGPQYLEENHKLSEVFDKFTVDPENMRTGYVLSGWSLDDSDDRQVITDEELDTLIQDVRTLNTEKKELFLYAVWAPKQDSKYTVIEWHQNVTRDGWDYFDSTECTGTTGTEILFSSDAQGARVYCEGDTEDAWYKYENTTNDKTGNQYFKIGFGYYGQEDSEYKITGAAKGTTNCINADGNTVVNVYVPRKEITITFKRFTYTYTPTSGNGGTQYGLVNGQYIELERSWGQWGYYTGWTWHNYNGTRYTRKGAWTDYDSFTGTYGETLKSAGYTWPSQYEWREGQSGDSATGTVTTFLDTFLKTVTLYSSSSTSGSYTINHYKQDVNGNYNMSSPDNTLYTEGNYTFYFKDKYNGFSVAWYSASGTEWTACHDPETNPDGDGATKYLGAYTLYILHERNMYNVVFKIIDPVSGDITTKTVSGVYFEKTLSLEDEVMQIANASSNQKTGYEFNWYKNPEGDPTGEHPERKLDFTTTTMPEGGIVIYGVYKPVKYKVTLHAEEGKFVNELAPKPTEDPNKQVTSFNVESTEEVDRNNLITGVEREGYELIGWYKEDGTPFTYGKITENVELYAHWRYQGVVKIVYDAGEHGSFGSETEFIPEYNYAPGTSAVVAAPPTNVYNGTDEEGNPVYYTFVGWKVIDGADEAGSVYYPNDVFTITTETIDNGVKRTIDEEEYRCVHVVAQYKASGTNPSEDELTTLIYDPNGGQLKSGVSEETNENGQVVITGLTVNEKVVAKQAIYTKPGYKQVSWNTEPDGSGLKVDFGKEHIAADNEDREKNLKRNTLYAIYEPVKLYVIISGTEETATYDGTEHENAIFSVKEVYYVENGQHVAVTDFDKSNVAFKNDGFKGAAGINVNRDADENVIAYTKSLSITDFKVVNSDYTDVQFGIDDENSEFKLTINPVEVTVHTEPKEFKYDGQEHGWTEGAKVTGLVNGETATVTATGKVKEVGDEKTNTYDIDWGTTNKDNYTIAEDLGTLKVVANTDEISITAKSASKAYDGTKLTADGLDDTLTTGLPEGFEITAVTGPDEDVINVADTATDNNKIKSWTIIETATGDDKTENFTNVTPNAGGLAITAVDVTITTGSATRQYNGKPLTNDDETTVEGIIDSEKDLVEIHAVGSVTDVNTNIEHEHNNIVEEKWGNVNKDNYNITYVLGTLTVTDPTVELTIRAEDGTWAYDGEYHTKPAVAISWTEAEDFDPSQFKVEASTQGQIKDYTEGGVDNEVVSYTITEKSSEADVTSKFTVHTEKGTLTITKLTATVTTGSHSFPYDGQSHRWTEGAGIEGLIDSEKDAVTVTAIGEVTEIEEGYVENTESIDWGNVNPNNYNLEKNLGKLNIIQNAEPISFTAASDEKSYDGSALTKAELDDALTTGLPEGFKVVATIAPDEPVINVADTAEGNNKIQSYEIQNAAGEDKTANFTDVTANPGTLTINPVEVTVHTEPKEFKYDGQEHGWTEGAKVTGLVNGETATVTATGKVKEVGDEKTNTYDIDWGTTNKDNYTIAEDLGTLKVVANTDEISITAKSASKAYDGTKLTADGLDDTLTTGLPEGFEITAVTGPDEDVINVADTATDNNKIKSWTIIETATGDDKTENFTNVTPNAGGLAITAVDVTITTGSATRQYNGKPLTNDDETTVEGIIDSEKDLVEIHAVGSVTDVNTNIEHEHNNIVEEKWGNVNKDNYNITYVLGTLTVTDPTVELTIRAEDGTWAYDGEYHTKPAVAISWTEAEDFDPSQFKVEASTQGQIKDYTEGGVDNEVVSYTITEKSSEADVTSKFTVHTEKGTLTITKLTATVTTGSHSFPYDGQSHRWTEGAGIEGLIDSEKDAVTVTAIGEVTEIEEGYVENTESIDWGNVNPNNYNLEKNLGKLNIIQNAEPISFTAASDEKSYDGSALTKAELDDALTTGLPEGFKVVATIAPDEPVINVADTAEGNNKIQSYEIQNAAGEDKTANFTDVTANPGTLTINPAELKITTKSDEQMYDGTALTAGATVETLAKKNTIPDKHNNEAVEVELMNGETATITLTAKLTKVDSIDNAYTITWGTAKAGNYKIVEDIGKLTVTNRGDEAFVVKASVDDVIKTYNGNVWKDFDYKLEVEETPLNTMMSVFRRVFGGMFGIIANADMNEETETTLTIGDATFVVTGVRVATEGTDTGNYPMKMDFSKAKVVDPEGNEVQDQFSFVEKEGAMGQLTINPVSLTITTGSASKQYDGTPITNEEASIDGIVERDKEYVIIRATGSQTEVGTSDNTYEIEWGNVNPKNYEILEENVHLGTLEVTQAPPTPPTPDPDPTPTTPVTIPDAPAPTAPTPAAQAVLGARREEPTSGQAVLGARRARTEDTTNEATRVFAIILAAATAVTLLLTGKKKKEEEEG